MKPVIVGISGGSGAVMAQRAVDNLLERGVPVVCTASAGGRQMWREELDEPFGEAVGRWERRGGFTYHNVTDIGAAIASGSFPSHGMLVLPCSMATVAAIAHGLADNLLRRAADVAIKERKPLVLVPRETPLSPIHLENMLGLARLGVVILPPEPAFYLKPQSVEDIVGYVVGKALEALGVEGALEEGMRYRGRKSMSREEG